MRNQENAVRALAQMTLVVPLFAVMGGVTSGQTRFADVEVRLVRTPARGCIEPCINNYTVILHGDGTVEYERTGFVEGRRTRSVSPGRIAEIVNEFLRARFFNALDTYGACCSTLVREGDSVARSGVGSADDPHVTLTLRIGARTKTVILRRDFPPDLGRLPALVDGLGGPRVWATVPTTQEPRKIRDVRPVVPPAAAELRGAVIIEITIGIDGKVENATVLRSIPLVDQAALDAVKQWEFTPAMINGQAVRMVTTVAVTFPR